MPGPTEMLRLCTISPYDRRDPLPTITKILAILHTTHDEQQLITKLRTLLEQDTRISIGIALDKLNSISDLTHEDGQDGIDALCYHLSEYHCTKSIQTLSHVIQRFKDDEAKKLTPN